jgi:tripartite-type tricarboxylate transporter receptor subunit TctC
MATCRFRHALALALAAVACVASAQRTEKDGASDYPIRPIRIIVPYTPGGTADVFARLIGQKLSDAWGQQVVVDNRAGSGGIIGTEIASRAPRDGYTLMMGNTPNIAINPALYKNLPFDTQRDFTPITMVALSPYVMVAPVALGVTTAKEFIALAKSRPGQLNYASLGSGSASHLSAELLQSMAGIKLVHVPYKVLGSVLTDLVSGQVQVFFLGLVSAQSQIKGGRLRAIGVTGPRRSPAMPDVPTIAESGAPGYDIVSWYGFFAPAGTPRHVITRVNSEVHRILALREMQERLAAEGAEVATNTPEQFAAYIKSEMTKWVNVVKMSGARPE